MKNLKKIFTISIYFILTGVTFVSCGSGKSFSQRHYNNRYYIGMSKNDASESTSNDKTKETESIDENQSTETFNIVPVTEDVTNAGKIETENALVENSENSDLTDLKESEQSKSPYNYNANNIDKIQEYPYAPIDHRIGEKEKAHSDSGDEVLSLIWIVILVLLILWALGLILGVGGLGLGYLIHILLVIALILLILWLLRII